METPIAYLELYKLQDRVLSCVTKSDTGFYLTGGTCLHRFIVPRRYSDDLDFFCSDNTLFRDYVRVAAGILKREGIDFKIEIDTRDFVRWMVGEKLKVDLVNDRVYRYGESQVSPQGFLIDNPQNILANKISAVIGRDEPKDLFDVAVFHSMGPIDWPFILNIAAQKCVLDRDYLLYRFQSFPTDLFDFLAVIDPKYRDDARLHLTEVVAELTDLA